MRLRLLLPLLALLAAMAIPGSADAKSRYKVGFGDQNAQIFSDKNFTSLKIKRVRLIVPYDFRREAYQLPQTTDWITRAQAAGDEVLVAFTAPRGCFNKGRYSKRSRCKAPSPAKFTKAFKDFRKLFPKVKLYQPWNEINSASQPIAKSPKRAAQYYNAAKKACKKCTIVAADLLDSSSVTAYIKKFKRYVKGSPKLWGLHNYSDVNRSRYTITTKVLKVLPGKVWLTETGGLVKFEKNFPYSTKRANKATKFLFKLADRFSKKRKGLHLRSTVSRIYPYTFFGESKGERFDAGLVGPVAKPTPRPAFKTFKKLVKSRSK